MTARKVLVDEDFFLDLGATSVEWGEPDEGGFYTPTIRHDRCPDCDEIPQNRIHHDRLLKAYHPYGGFTGSALVDWAAKEGAR